ncbi:50S ribosomal protein L10 [Candidatus Curtissbacteria bacterium]|nr:50S ribosomal protein L10 [Candidatus Curtissbacteria bacterium]
MDQKHKSAFEVKKEAVVTLTEKVGRAKTIAFAKYHGLTVNQIGALRQTIKAGGGEMLVAKNTLIKRALLKNNLEAPKEDLLGPIATILSYEDEIAPIKAVADSSKKLGFPTFVFGFFGSRKLDVSGLDALAKIPGRDVLQGQVVGTLVSPIRGIVTVLNANIRNRGKTSQGSFWQSWRHHERYRKTYCFRTF